ncbi:MAG: glycerophosphodiester phosphodiesterase [Pseudomonadota bacterium]
MTFVVGHRCGNDLATLRSAAASGVAVVEADVHLYRGRLEVRHLKSLGPLLWDTWYLASPSTPRLLLRDLLAACPPGVELMLDLKGPRRAIARLVLDAVRPYRGRLRLAVCGRHPRVLAAFRGDPDVRLVRSLGSRRALRAFLRSGGREDTVSVRAEFLDAETTAALRARAGRILTWPVRTPEAALHLRALGVDGLITERLDLVDTLRAAA